MQESLVSNKVRLTASGFSFGQHKTKCPECKHTREKNKHDRSLSLMIDGDGVKYHCHHCNLNGGWMHKQELDLTGPPLMKVNGGTNSVVTDYLKSRSITDEVIEAHTIQDTYTFNGMSRPAVGFPYREDSNIVAIKWRSVGSGDKFYSQENVCQDFFNLDEYVSGNDVLLVEGEIDALSWLSCDLPENLTVLSIPNGAPSKVKDGRVDPKDDVKFRYVWRAKKQLESAERIILCFDSDEPGVALRDEIVRRVGTDKIWLVDLDDYKDTNEALTEGGSEYLLGRLEESLPIPTVGLYAADVFADEYIQLYEEGHMRGARTGIQLLDNLIQIVPGMLTVVTGFPSSGKSDLVDQICLNLARSEGWKTCYCSFEKPPALHMAQLSQKLMDTPFFEGIGTRMSREERDYAFEWIKDHFLFMDHAKKGPSTIDGILDVASSAVMRMGVRILVIDPYNFIELPSYERETDAISRMLTTIQKWLKAHDCHCFFVAHPTKLAPDRRSDKKVVVTGHDIAGSASWFAKADIGLTAWRHPSDIEPPEAHVWKVRWSWIGAHGSCPLKFNRATGKWSDYMREVQDDGRWDF